MAVLGAASLAIALFGLASVITLTVRQRLKEVGIRAALGATPSQVLRVVLGETSKAMLVGLAVGAISSNVAIGAGRHVLYGVADLATPLAAGAFVLVIVRACGAMLTPARKILRISPARALRID